MADMNAVIDKAGHKMFAIACTGSRENMQAHTIHGGILMAERRGYRKIHDTRRGRRCRQASRCHALLKDEIYNRYVEVTKQR